MHSSPRRSNVKVLIPECNAADGGVVVRQVLHGVRAELRELREERRVEAAGLREGEGREREPSRQDLPIYLQPKESSRMVLNMSDHDCQCVG